MNTIQKALSITLTTLLLSGCTSYDAKVSGRIVGKHFVKSDNEDSYVDVIDSLHNKVRLYIRTHNVYLSGESGKEIQYIGRAPELDSLMDIGSTITAVVKEDDGMLRRVYDIKNLSVLRAP